MLALCIFLHTEVRLIRPSSFVAVQCDPFVEPVVVKLFHPMAGTTCFLSKSLGCDILFFKLSVFLSKIYTIFQLRLSSDCMHSSVETFLLLPGFHPNSAVID